MTEYRRYRRRARQSTRALTAKFTIAEIGARPAGVKESPKAGASRPTTAGRAKNLRMEFHIVTGK